MSTPNQDLLLSSLLELGLTEFESNLYQALLKEDAPSVTPIAKQLNVERLTVYRGLRKLEELGLVSARASHSRLIPVEPPTKIISLLKQRQSTAYNLSDQLTALLPDLLNNYYQGTRQPKIRVFEGRESFISLLDELVNESDGVIYTVGSPSILAFVPDYMDTYIQNRRKKNILSKHMAFRSPWLAMRDQKKDLREVKWFPPEYKADAAFSIYGNKVAIWNTVMPKFVVIEDRIIRDLFKAVFDALWGQY